MPLASTHQKQRSKNWLLLAVLLLLIASIYYLTVIRVGVLAAMPREIPVGKAEKSSATPQAPATSLAK